MFCEKCGNRLRDGSAFCNNCGAPVEDGVIKNINQPVAGNYDGAVNQPVNSQMNYENEAVQTQAAFVEEQPSEEYQIPQNNRKKPNGKEKILVIAVLAVLILFIGVGVACRLVPGITNAVLPRTTNFIMKNFASPERYLKFVITDQGGKTVGKTASDFVEALTNFDVLGNNSEGNIKLTAGAGLKDIIKENAGAMAAPYLDWMESIGISYDGGINGGVGGYKLGLSVNDSNILNLDSVVDFKNNSVYISVPELNSKAVKTELGSGLEDLEDMEYVLEAKNVFNNVVEEVALDRLINRYIACVVESAGDAEKDSEKVTAGDVTQKYTVISVDIDEADAINMLKAVLKEAREDKELETIIRIFCQSERFNANPEEIYSEFVAGIDEMLQELNDTTVTTGEEHINLKFWVNNKGEIVGAGMEVEDATVKCLSVEKGNKFGVKLSAGANIQNITFEGGGKISGGKKTGDFALSVMGADIVNAKIENFEVKEDAGFNGKITVQPVEEISDVLSMVGAEDMQDILSGARIELIGADDVTELAVYTNEQLFASIHMSDSQKQGESTVVDIPAEFVDSADSNAMNTWVSELSFTALIDKFRQAGAPELLLSMVEMGLAQELQAPEAESAEAQSGSEIVLPDVELEMPTFQ